MKPIIATMTLPPTHLDAYERRTRWTTACDRLVMVCIPLVELDGGEER